MVEPHGLSPSGDSPTGIPHGGLPQFPRAPKRIKKPTLQKTHGSHGAWRRTRCHTPRRRTRRHPRAQDYTSAPRPWSGRQSPLRCPCAHRLQGSSPRGPSAGNPPRATPRGSPTGKPQRGDAARDQPRSSLGSRRTEGRTGRAALLPVAPSPHASPDDRLRAYAPRSVRHVRRARQARAWNRDLPTAAAPRVRVCACAPFRACARVYARARVRMRPLRVRVRVRAARARARPPAGRRACALAHVVFRRPAPAT